jgi:phage terminase Nu1 subunit (DNA packaging protein)
VSIPARPWVVGSQSLVAEFFGVHGRTVAEWSTQGMPRMAQPGGKWRYDLSAIAAWRIEELTKRAAPAIDADAEDLAGDLSPALEEFRRHRARLAKVQADEAEQSVISRSAAREAFGRFANVFRRLGHVFKTRFPEAHEMLDDAMIEAKNSIATLLEGDADAESSDKTS